MQIVYRNRIEDLYVALRTLPWSDRIVLRGTLIWLTAIGSAVPGLAVLVACQRIIAAVIGASLCCAATLLFVRTFRRAGQTEFPELTMRVRQEFLEHQCDKSWNRRSWTSVRSVLVRQGMVILRFKPWNFAIIPAAALDSAAVSADELTQLVDEHRTRASQDTIETPPAPDGFAPGPVRGSVSFVSLAEDLIPPVIRFNKSRRDEGTSSRPKQSGILSHFYWLFLTAGLAIVVFLFPSRPVRPDNPIQVLVDSLLFCLSYVVIWLLAVILLRHYSLRQLRRQLNQFPHHYHLTDGGVLLESQYLLAFLAWENVRSVSSHEGRTVIRDPGNSDHVIPERAFASFADAEQFGQLAQQLHSNYHSPILAQFAADDGNPYQPPIS